MSENFKITISAVDKATASIRRINQSMTGLTRPFSEIGRSTRALGNEAWSNPMINGVRKVGSAAGWSVKKITALISPINTLAGAGTIAGIAALAESWGRAGVQLSQASQRIGMAIGRLQGFRGAATAAGLSAGDMQGALVGLGDTLQDALMGRNQQALMMLSRLGINIKKDAGGVVDTAQAMNDIADAVARIGNPQTQALVARSFGLEGMLPILREGSAGLQRYIALSKQLGAVDEEAAASNERLGQSFNRLKLAYAGFENRVSKKTNDVFRVAFEGWTSILSGGAYRPDASKLPGWIGGTEGQAGKNPRKSSGSIGAMLPDYTAKGSSVPNLRQQIRDQIQAGLVSQTALNPGIASAARLSDGRPQPLGLRQNNPGNLRSWGDRPVQNGFATFETPQMGLTAMARQLALYGTRGINTVNGIVNKYAPSSENDTGAYIGSVTRQTGFDPNQQLNMGDPKTLAPLLSSMVRQEQGQQPFSPEEIGRAVADALAKNPPPAAVVKVESGSGAKVMPRSGRDDSGPTRIAYTMPDIQ